MDPDVPRCVPLVTTNLAISLALKMRRESVYLGGSGNTVRQLFVWKAAMQRMVTATNLSNASVGWVGKDRSATSAYPTPDATVEDVMTGGSATATTDGEDCFATKISTSVRTTSHARTAQPARTRAKAATRVTVRMDIRAPIAR